MKLLPEPLIHWAAGRFRDPGKTVAPGAYLIVRRFLPEVELVPFRPSRRDSRLARRLRQSGERIGKEAAGEVRGEDGRQRPGVGSLGGWSRFGMIPVKALEMRDSMKPASGTLLAADTLPEAQRMQVMLWRQMSTLEKARVIGEISNGVRELAMAGIRLRHPSASERECRLRYALLSLGRSLALTAYPEAEALHNY